jgi:thiamine biosynthesis lipoprotein
MVTRAAYEIAVWGTVLYIEASSTTVDRAAIDSAIVDVKSFVYGVDEDFSTYKDGSFVSRLRRGEIEIGQCPRDVQDVWSACLDAKYLSDGAFDPWAVAGGFDPSGYVKGWAADRVGEILVAAGAAHVQVNAAGDVTVRGGNLLDSGAVEPWRIGVVNPDQKREVVQVFELMDGAVATSGAYERGAHITDPFTGVIAIGAKSATVVGPDGGLADAMATALMVAGDDGAQFLAQAELHDYSAWCIDRYDDSAWGVGREFTKNTTGQTGQKKL